MSRIQTPALISDAPVDAQARLEAVNNRLGSVPNMFKIIANSPATLEGFFGFASALNKGTLPEATRERIALAVAEVNSCHYCVAAHSYLGQKNAKLTFAEIARNRKGRSTDVKADVAVRFAKAIAEHRGQIDNSLFNEVKTAGYNEAQIVEIIAHVALNTMTNYVNEVLGTEIDFPNANKLAA